MRRRNVLYNIFIINNIYNWTQIYNIIIYIDILHLFIVNNFIIFDLIQA